MNTMIEKAVGHLHANPDQACTLNELRKAAGITLRSQYRLSEQLKADPRVANLGGNRFALAGTDRKTY